MDMTLINPAPLPAGPKQQAVHFQELQELLKKPLEVRSFLKIALKITGVVSLLHERKIVHQNLNPGSVLISSDGKRVRLKTLSPAEAHSPSDLRYISPEQTGRFNREVDQRTDLYSLGILFYQMLSGEPPFNSPDPLELVYAHLAREALPLHQLRPDIPPILSEIVRKLLHKKLEDRYQTACALQFDLKKCHELLSFYDQDEEKPEEIGMFEIAQFDKIRNFNIGNQLYGRDAELQTLKKVYASVKKGRQELIFITGYSGVGKTSVVNQFLDYVRAEEGSFSAGKFDQYKSNVPYTAFIQAIQSLLREILSENQTVVERWKEKVLSALAPNAQLIVDVIPELSMIIGPQQPAVSLAPPEAQNRFNAVFLSFIQLFAAQEKPLVLFLDDLQWADLSSLRLIEQLVADRSGYIMLIGAYRDNEIDSAHPIRQLFAQLKKGGLAAEVLDLKPLSLNHVNVMIAKALNRSLKESLSLAEVCFAKTKGNPFFLIQFLHMLKEEELLSLDPLHLSWGWDISAIRELQVTDNVVDLMISKIGRLPASTIETLKLAACIGNSFDMYTLEIVTEKSERVIGETLAEAVKSGLIQEKDGYYNFLHDRVQQAAYSLLEDETKMAAHYKIGRLLYTNLTEEEQENRLFELVDHLNIARARIDKFTERYMLASLNLRAGQKAKASSAYERAFDYFNTAKGLCPGEIWNSKYTFMLELHIQLAQMAYVCTHFQRMEEVAAETIVHCRDILDQARISEIMIATYTAENKLEKAIQTAANILGVLGVDFPRKPHLGHVFIEYLKTLWALQGKQSEDLLNLPLMTDEKYKTVMRILNSISIGSYSASYNTVILIAFKALRISLNYGITEETIVAYSGYGYIINMLWKRADKGYEFGLLALKLQEKLGVKRFDCKIRMMFNMVIRHGKDPLRATLEDFPDTYLSGFASGDLLSAGHSIMQYFVYSFFSGRQLAVIEREMQEHQKAMHKTGHETSLRLCQLYRQTALNLAGKTPDPCAPGGEYFNEESLLPVYTQSNDRTIVFNIYFHRLLKYFHFQQHKQALENLPFVEAYLDGVLGTFCLPLVHFYGSLVLAANYEDFSFTKRYQSKRKIKGSIRSLEKLARSAPENIVNKLNLLKAELARLESKDFAAATYYDLAIEYGRTHQFIQEEALANELAAEFYLSRGRDTSARFYLQQALDCYREWGAQAKVADLRKRYPKFLEQAPNPALAKDMPDLDLSTIIKIGQAISSEIVLEDLLKLLIKIMLQNSGAQTVILIRNDDNRLTIEAEGKAEDSSIRLLQSRDLNKASLKLPVKLISYVVRTGETITFDGELKDRSIFLLPVIIKHKVIGLFYLENNLVSGIFTQERLYILQLLASQIAISLDNALQYQNLQSIIDKHTWELTEKNIALRESNRKLAEANENKTRYVANVSHEIRTPLQGIMGLTSLLKKSQRYNEDYVKLIQSSAESLLGIINDILDISRIESNRLVIEERAFNLKELLGQILEYYEPQAGGKGILLISSISPDIPDSLRGDPLRISQILNNLLNNAFKFTHQGSVLFRARCCTVKEMLAEVEFTVEDTGIGISPKKQQTIFESFTQGDNSITRKYGGTGLGLTIVKRLVELMDGQIEVESREKEGSRFRCLLPLGRVAKEEIAAAEDGSMFDAQEKEGLKGLKIIAAEDNLANQTYIKHILAYHNCAVTIVNNGVELLEALKGENYDCIMLDKNMPVMGGMETTRIIRGQEGPGKHIPIIALTASAILGDREKLLEQGVDYYLAKPIREDCLLSILEEIRNSGEANKESSDEYPTDYPQDPPREERSDELIDQGVFRQEAELFGQSVMLSIIEDFLQNYQGFLDKIQIDLDACDSDQLEKSAHRLASALSCLYATKVFELAKKLEREAQAGNWQELKDQFEILRQLMPSLTVELQRLKRNLADDSPHS